MENLIDKSLTQINGNVEDELGIFVNKEKLQSVWLGFIRTRRTKIMYIMENISEFA